MDQAFKNYQPIPTDPIFSLSREAAQDTRPFKVDLTIGIYKDPSLKSIIFQSIKKAETQLLSEEQNKDYLPIAGFEPFITSVKNLVLGSLDMEMCGIQSLGGTGALYLGAHLLAESGTRDVLISNPTWVNHKNIFSRAGFAVHPYPYYDRETQSFLFSEFTDALRQAKAGSIVVLHGCCHNPSGADPSLEQWKEISQICREKELVPFFDLAYQGFGEGIEEDVAGVRQFASDGHEMLIASSFSKNFGLYGERTGTLLVISPNASALKTHLQAIARATYSNPPRHGALLAQRVLSDGSLRKSWEEELSSLRERMERNRVQLADGLMLANPSRDYTYLKKRKGMFCYLNLSSSQVDFLKQEKAIYMTGAGRINISGLNDTNLTYVIESICALGA